MVPGVIISNQVRSNQSSNMKNYDLQDNSRHVNWDYFEREIETEDGQTTRTAAIGATLRLEQ